MTTSITSRGMSRRELLKNSVAVTASMSVDAGFISGVSAAWAVETQALKPETMATLVQMARDIYPHDHVGDEYYVIAVKGYDTAESAPEIEAGVAALDAAAQGGGHASYLGAGWEQDRVDILRSMENSGFFQKIRGGLVTGLYNQQAVWPLFGYEGASYELGGYINRGFDDINWL